MLVVVDMGNTNITMGLFKDDQLIGNYRLTTKLQNDIRRIWFYDSCFFKRL